MTDGASGLDAARKQREAIEKLAQQDRSDNLDAAARIVLNGLDEKQPATEDLKAWGIGGSDDYGFAHKTPSVEMTIEEFDETLDEVLNEVDSG